MDFRSELYDVVEYSLYNDTFGSLIIEEPVGWESDIPEINKSKKNFSTVTKYSTNLEFVLKGANYIKEVYETLGFDAKIILKKRAIHPTESKVQNIYSSILDGYTFVYEKNRAKVSSLESELISLIATYDSEEVELNNTTSLDGTDIGELNINKCWIDGKNIQLVSKWGAYEEKTILASPNQIRVIPLENYAQSDLQTGSTNDTWIGSLTGDGQIEYLFYSVASEDKTVYLDFDIDLSLALSPVNQYDTIAGFVQLVLVTYEDNLESGGDQWDYVSHEYLATSTVTGNNDEDQILIYKDRAERTILKGQSWGLYLRVTSENDVDFTINKTNLILTEDTHYEATQSQTILPFELFERLLRIITGRTDFILESDYFGRTDLGYTQDGAGAYLGVANGFWAREFNDKPLVTSWADAIKSFGVVADISYDVKTKNEHEYIKLEVLNPDFFTEKVTQLPNVVDDIKISTSKEFSFSSIDIGYEKGGDEYEEAIGLDEFNGKHSYTTPVAKNKQKLELISKYRADMTGFEFARRKPQKNFPTEDTRYDEDVFFLDMKKGDTEILLQRKFDDDYISIDKIYSPETATNLRLSPKQLLIKHGWFIKNCLTKYTDKYIHFISATGNSQLILDGVQENDNFLINLLNKEKFTNVDIDFSHETNLELYNEIQDNINGIIEITDNKGKVNRVRLFKLSKNKYNALLIS